MGVHHAWGRTLKDVFQRFQAARGHELRYQNGFDCQGLWVEVEVEKALGLNSKRDIEEYGLAEFSARCRERVAEFARGDHPAVQAARDVDGLGQRLLHLQRHEHRVHLAVPQGGAPPRLAVQGPPLDAVVPALRDVAVRSTSRPARGTTRSSTTRRSTSASRCATARASRWSSGRRRRGRCRRTSRRRSSRTRTTG